MLPWLRPHGWHGELGELLAQDFVPQVDTEVDSFLVAIIVNEEEPVGVGERHLAFELLIFGVV